MGPIQSCDTCMVSVNGKLVRACATPVTADMSVATEGEAVDIAQREAFDRILKNHMLYCTVCDNNNQNCTVHNTTAELDVKHQSRPYTPKPYEKDMSNPFYRYDPDQCILCGRCVEACQSVQVNETLTIEWESANPRVLWDGGTQIEGSSCVSCGHCVTVCPCNALMEKSMLGHAGYLTNLPDKALTDMIEVVKGIEPPIGYGPILALSEMESEMRHERVKRTKTVCTYCAVWMQLRRVDSRPAHPEDRADAWAREWDFYLHQGQVCVGAHVNSDDRLTYSRCCARAIRLPRDRPWDEALDVIEKKVQRASRQEHGPDALAFIASSKCTNEESFLMQKLARAVIGDEQCGQLRSLLPEPGDDGVAAHGGVWRRLLDRYADIEKAGLVLIVGANPAENHPVLATRVKRSHKFRGQRLIVADLRKHEMAERADLFFRPNPSTDALCG